MACCIDVDKANVNRALWVRVIVHCVRAPGLSVSTVLACPAPSYTCPAHTCAQVLLTHGCHTSFACIDLSPWMIAYGLLCGWARAPLIVSQPLGGDSPPLSWSRGGDTYNWRAAEQEVDLVLTVTSSMHHQDLTPILPPTQH